jgi:CheY-like chemotaxis protein
LHAMNTFKVEHQTSWRYANNIMRQTIKGISILAAILSILWFAFEPGFKPAITALVGIAGLIATSLKRETNDTSSEEKKRFRKRKSILYIDDDLIRTLFHMLHDLGYKVMPADNAELALGELKRKKYDLILLDIMMQPLFFVSREKGGDGYETGVYLTQKIRESINKETPIIVITGNPISEVEAKLQDIGVIAYLRKPLELQDLEKEIESALS